MISDGHAEPRAKDVGTVARQRRRKNGESVLFDDDRTRCCRPLLCRGSVRSIGLQGQRSLNRWPGKHFEQEVVAPATASTFHGDAVSSRMLL